MDINAKRYAQITAQLRASPKSARQLGRSVTQVARNLYAMLEDAQRLGVSKKSLFAKARGGTRDELQAQKKLDTITVPPAIDAVALERRLGRLQRKPDQYVEVARLWAKALGRSEVDAVLRLFDGTDYGAGRAIDEDDFDGVARIADALRIVASQVAEDESQRTFWERLLKTPGRYDPRFKRVLPAAQSIIIEAGGFKGNAICADEMSPVASVSLARRLQKSPSRGAIWIDPAPEAPQFEPSNELAMPYLTRVGFGAPTSQDGSQIREWSTETMERRDIDYLHWLDIRLAVAPHADNTSPITSDIGPLLELRTVLEAELNGARVTFDNPFHDGCWGFVRWAKVGGRWHRVVIERSDIDPPPTISNEFFDMPEHHYFAWGELSARSLESLLEADFLPQAHPYYLRGTDFSGISDQPLFTQMERRIDEGIAEELLQRADDLREMVRRHRAGLSSQLERRVSEAVSRVKARAAKRPANDEE